MAGKGDPYRFVDAGARTLSQRIEIWKNKCDKAALVFKHRDLANIRARPIDLLERLWIDLLSPAKNEGLLETSGDIKKPVAIEAAEILTHTISRMGRV